MKNLFGKICICVLCAVCLFASSCGSAAVANGIDGKDGVNGTDGIDGKDGADGRNGADGADGVGIVDGYLDEYGHLILRLSDGNLIDAGAFTADMAATAYSEGLYYQKLTEGDNESLAVKSIGCAYDTEIVIPSVYRGFPVTEIMEEAFLENAHITSVNVPATVRAIGSNAFSGCENLKSVYTADLAAWCTIAFSNGNANPLNGGATLYWNGQPVTELVLTNVAQISDYAFNYCGSLETVTLGGDVRLVGRNAFSSCAALEEVTVGVGVQSIGAGAFMMCASLTAIVYEGTQEQWLAIEKGGSWDFGTGSYTVRCSDGDIVKTA